MLTWNCKHEEKEKVMEIIKTNIEKPTASQVYFLTMTPEAEKMSAHAGETITFDYWAVYEDVNSHGEIQRILSIVDRDNRTYSTISPTFIEEFLKIVAIFDATAETFERFKISEGTSNAGRKFITCVFAPCGE